MLICLAKRLFFCSYKNGNLILANQNRIHVFTIDQAVFEEEELSLTLANSYPILLEPFEGSNCMNGTELQWKLQYHVTIDFAAYNNQIFILSDRYSEYFITNVASTKMIQIQSTTTPKMTTSTHLNLLVVGTTHKQNELVSLLCMLLTYIRIILFRAYLSKRFFIMSCHCRRLVSSICRR